MARARQPVFLISAIIAAVLIAISLIPSRFTHAQSGPTRIVGSAETVTTSSVTVKPDHGAAVTLTSAPGARILETAPGAKTLAGATAVALSAIAPGDRVLAVGSPTAGGGLAASMIIVMKASAIAARDEAEQAAWQKNGAGGLVKSVDAATGTITLASVARTMTVATTKSTVVRRYSPDSIAFSASTPSTLSAIQPGDQLRARAAEPPTDGRMTALAIVFGAFRNIAGTITSVDAAADTITVRDLKTKKPVVIHVTSASQMHQIPEPMARELAMRLNRSAAKGHGGYAQRGEHGAAVEAKQAAWRGQAGGAQGANTHEQSISAMLAKTPVVTLTELRKGQALMIVATEGTPDAATAITLLSGVEPILTAPPAAAAGMFSASWNVGGSAQGASEPGTGTGGTP